MTFWSNASVGASELGHISCPVLLIAGDEDDHAPIATMMQAQDLIPDSRLCIVPKAWYTAFLNNESVVLAAMVPFINADRPSLTPSTKVPYNEHFVYKK